MPQELIYKKLIVQSGYIEYIDHFSYEESLGNYLQIAFSDGLMNIINLFDPEYEDLLIKHNFAVVLKKFVETVLKLNKYEIPAVVKFKLNAVFENVTLNSEKLRAEIIKIELNEIALKYFEISAIAIAKLN